MYKTCIDWLINSTHLCTSVEFLLDVHPVSSVLGLLNLNMILIFSSLISNACIQHAWTSEIINSLAWTIFCTAVQTRKNAGNFCVLDADAVRSERVVPVLLLTSDHHQSMPGYKTKYWKFAEIKRWGFTNFERFGRVVEVAIKVCHQNIPGKIFIL